MREIHTGIWLVVRILEIVHPAIPVSYTHLDFVIATAIPEKLRQAGGYRYRNARRPELYADIIGQPHESNQKVAWLTETTNSK